MRDLGQYLRTERKKQQMSLEQMQEITKIRRRYIEAIEEGDLDVLPGKFYVRAFIKQYCESLGLVAEDVFQQFAPQLPLGIVDPSRETIPLTRSTPNAELQRRPNQWISFVLVIAFPILIVAVIYYFVTNQPAEPAESTVKSVPLNERRSPDTLQKGGASTDVNQTPSLLEKPPVVLPEASQNTVTFRETTKQGNATVEQYDVVGKSVIEVRVRINEDEAWIGVSRADRKNKYVYQAKMVAGDTYTQTMDTDTFVVLGRANAVELTVNGVTIDTGNEPNPRRFVFTRGLKTPPSSP